jgi:AcrR family transcriptional regulator
MSELVSRTGVGAGTVRYYLAEGLLPPPHRLAANRFVYDERHVEVIRLIRLLRSRRRLSLEAIGRLLPELLPDLVGNPEGGVFRPEMWQQLLSPDSAAAAMTTAGRLVAEGLAAFSSRGYFDVTIDDVCRAAGIAKGSFYRHFSSKEELLFAAVRDASSRLQASLAARAAKAELAESEVPGELETALFPYRVLVFDLASLAGQGREAHGRVLEEFLSSLTAAVTRSADLGEAAAAADVDRALALLFRASPARPAGGVPAYDPAIAGGSLTPQ